MSARTKPPYRADHVGSLLRPRALLDARAKHAAGNISAEELRAVEDDAIREAVAMQREVGLQSATDGEFRRASWHMDFIYRLGGITQVEGESLHVQFRNAEDTWEYAPPAMRVAGKLSLGETIFGEHFSFLREVAGEGVTPKLTIPSPSMVHYRGGQFVDRPRRLSRPRRVLGRSDRGLQRRSCGACTTWAAATCSSTTRASPTSTTRPSAPTSSRSAATPSTCTSIHREHQPRARRASGGPGGDDAHVPRQRAVDVGRRGRL